MAVGRAVITTDVPGCRETVEDGVNGFLVAPWDSEALAKKMKWFIDNPDKIITMGDRSREMAEERFDVEQVNTKLLRSEEHTSELQSCGHLVCRLLLEKKK